MRPRLLLVNPRQHHTFFGFSLVGADLGVPAFMPNLALPTLAALVPDDIEVVVVDEEVEEVPFDEAWDLVGLTGYISQASRLFEIATEFRRRGRLVVIGGPYASLSPDTVRPHADVLFTGEAEHTWPAFLADWQAGSWRDHYEAGGTVGIDESPLPDLSVLAPGAYWIGVVQTSRGCPYQCEFCDVIVYLGRRQRHKAPDRVVTELDRLYAAGYRSVFLSDDNLTSYPHRAARIMEAVRDWNRGLDEPVYLATQLSIEVTEHPELLALCADAGLRHAFVGLETPSPDALREVKKGQNLRADLVEGVHTLHRHGIMVNGGVITGFDADTLDSFRLVYDFVQDAGFPMVNVNMLHAPEGTPLEARLRADGRLFEGYSEVGAFDTNVVPLQMSLAELQAGTQWLLNKLYSPGALLARVETLASLLPDAPHVVAPARAGDVEVARSAQIWRRLLASYADLGGDYAALPRRAVRAFRGKDTSLLLTALVFARQAIGVIEAQGIRDPALGALDAPVFPERELIVTVGAS